MATINVQSIVLTGWNDLRTAVELWVFSETDWVDVDGILHGAGNPSNRIWTQRITGLTVDTGADTLTLPLVPLTSTRDAVRGSSVRLYFWIMAIAGSSATPIKQLPGTQSGLQVPASLTSVSGCSPLGTCCTWAELIQYNTPSPPLPPPSYYNKDEIDRMLAALSLDAFAPAAATYLVQTASGGLSNEQAMGVLATGLVKNTTATGVQSIAVPDTDYLTPSGSGALLASLNASQLASGTVPDARFPATLPALSGANLTNLNATNLASGTVPLARLSGITTTQLSASAGILNAQLANSSVTINGTANQVSVSGSPVSLGGSATLSLTGPYTPATYTANGVLYGNTASSIQATAQGATNSVLIGGGAPSFSVTPSVDRFTINPAAINYDLVSNTFAYGLGFGTGIPGSPTTYNVPASKQLVMLSVSGENSGEGKMIGYEFILNATGATQDAGQEPVRGILGRVTNSGTGNAKTSAIRAGASGSGSNASLLIGVDADVTPVAGTNNASAVFGVTVEGSTDDVASGLLLYQGSSNPRYLQGVGSIAPIKFGAVAYRAWMGTGSAAFARGFQQLNNSGTETFYTDLSGNIVTLGIITAGSGAVAITNSTGNVLASAVANLGLVFIATVNASSQATVDFTTGLDDTYDAYVIKVSNAKPATDDVEAWLRIGTGGGPTYQTSGYGWSAKITIDTTEIAPVGVTSDGQIEMSFAAGGTVAVGNASGEGWSGTIDFDNPDGSFYPMFRFGARYNRAADGLGYAVYGAGQYNTVGAITGIRFMFSSGDVASGRFTLYGHRKS
jgi:hypothetical protein